MKTGELDAAIQIHKYQGRWGWGIIFARVLLGYLDRNPVMNIADLIIPMPSFNPNGLPRQGNDHTGWVIESAIDQDDVGHPFHLDPHVIVKIRETPRMATARTAVERRHAAERLRKAGAARVVGLTLARAPWR
jgi:predicted amidophosphoribosyltransferase